MRHRCRPRTVRRETDLSGESVMRTFACAAAILLAVGTGLPLHAQAEDYYRGKTLRIIVGTPAGGGYDSYARLVGRHIVNFIPGQPTAVVTNMPGASGTKAATYLYGIAPKDGTAIAIF